MVRTIGVLTGGGDCPGLNAVIRAVVKAAVGKYGLNMIGIEDGYRGLIENRARPLGLSDVSGILPRGGTVLGTSNRDNPFRYMIEGEARDVSDSVISHARELNIEVLISIGGDGTLSIAHELSLKGLSVIGVPKTIDNDLLETDLTFGFDTAVATATEAIDRLHTTAESHHRVMILEVMGRNAGWIALTAGLSGGADCILIPEIPYNLEKVIAKVAERNRTGKKFSIVVVAEGVHEGEAPVGKQVDDPDCPIRLGGVGNVIGEQIERMSGVETRVTVLGHLQRGGSPTAFDRMLGTRFGVHAVELVVEGKFNQMVRLQGQLVNSVPLGNAIKKQKLVPPNCDLVKTARALGVCLG